MCALTLGEFLIGDPLIADDHGKGGIPVPLAPVARHPRATVEAHEIAFFECALPGDAVNNDVVDGNAHGRRVSRVVQEVRCRACSPDRLRRDGIELASRDPGARCLTKAAVNIGDDQADLTHPLDLFTALELDPPHFSGPRARQGP